MPIRIEMTAASAVSTTAPAFTAFLCKWREIRLEPLSARAFVLGRFGSERNQLMFAHWTEAEQQPLPVQRTLQVYFAKHPVIARINIVAAHLTGILGPMFWAALIIGFFWAELFAS